MPARNHTAAKITVRRTYASPRSFAAVAFSKLASASAFSCVASLPACKLYSGIANGEDGALAFVRGFVASHASTARFISGRDRQQDERFFVGSSHCDRAYVLQKHADVDDFKGIETAGIHGRNDGHSFFDRQPVVLPRFESGPPGRLGPAPRRQHGGSQDRSLPKRSRPKHRTPTPSFGWPWLQFLHSPHEAPVTAFKLTPFGGESPVTRGWIALHDANPLGVGLITFACLFGAALFGMRLRVALPEHRSGRSLFGTFSRLVSASSAPWPGSFSACWLPPRRVRVQCAARRNERRLFQGRLARPRARALRAGGGRFAARIGPNGPTRARRDLAAEESSSST